MRELAEVVSPLLVDQVIPRPWMTGTEMEAYDDLGDVSWWYWLWRGWRKAEDAEH